MLKRTTNIYTKIWEKCNWWKSDVDFFFFHQVIIKNLGNITFPSKIMCQNFQVIYSVAYPTPSWTLWAFHWFVRSFGSQYFWDAGLSSCSRSVTSVLRCLPSADIIFNWWQFVTVSFPSGLHNPADLRLRSILGAFRTSGAVPSGLFGHPLFWSLFLEGFVWRLVF